jgi:hypothetical protein
MVADLSETGKEDENKTPNLTQITLIYTEKPKARTYRGFARMLADIGQTYHGGAETRRKARAYH